MKPIADSLDRLQGEKNVSIGCILPCLYYIRAELSRTDIVSKYNNNLKLSTIVIEMQQTMKTIVERRFSAIMKFDKANKDLVLAAVSHPVYKLNWIADEVCVGLAKTLLEEEAGRLDTISAYDTLEEIFEIEDDEFLTTISSVIRRSSTEGSSSIGVEMLNFYHERNKNIDILNKYPTIGRIFRRYNTTLSSSSPVERLFSQALLIFTPRRNRVSDANFEKALLLQKNKELWS